MAYGLIARLRGLPREHVWKYSTFAFVFLLSLYIPCCMLVGSDFFGMDDRSPKSMMEGTGVRPHVYRQLVPLVTRAVVAVTPQAMEGAVTGGLHDIVADNYIFRAIAHVRHWRGPKPPELGDDRLYPLLVVTLISYAALVGYFACMWTLAGDLFRSLSVQVLAVSFAALSLPPFCAKYGYIYDFPVLFFTAFLTLMLVRERWRTFCIVLAIATLNKETTIYLIAVYFLYARTRLSKREYLVYGLVQTVLFAVVKIGVNVLYASQRGVMMDYGFYRHIDTGVDGYSVYTLLGFAACVGLFGYRWEEKPVILKQWLGLLPVAVLVWVLLGNRNEYRIFYEMFPALTLLSAHTMACVIRKNQGFQAS